MFICNNDRAEAGRSDCREVGGTSGTPRCTGLASLSLSLPLTPSPFPLQILCSLVCGGAVCELGQAKPPVGPVVSAGSAQSVSVSASREAEVETLDPHHVISPRVREFTLAAQSAPPRCNTLRTNVAD